MNPVRMALDPHERVELLKIAREAIEEAVLAAQRGLAAPAVPSALLATEEAPRPAASRDRSWTGAIAQPRGAFVSVHVDGRLRGCVGVIQPDEPLHQTVRESARAAATRDTRFDPLAPGELERARIEISVLTRPLRVDDPSRIEVGRHGLIVSWGVRKGILLPQVASQERWDAETFLAQTCRKAGLPSGAWREGATVEAFEAEVFGEGAE